MRALPREIAEIRRVARHLGLAGHLARMAAEMAALTLFVAFITTVAIVATTEASTSGVVMIVEAR